jgi:hypothetical protein
MRKFYSLGVALLATVFVSNVDAQRYGMDPATAYVNQDFEGLTVQPFTTVKSILTNALHAGLSVDGSQLLYTVTAQGGDRGILATVCDKTDLTGEVYYEFDWNVGTAHNEHSKYSTLIVRGADNLAIFGFFIENWNNLPTDNKLHCLNLDPTTIGTLVTDNTTTPITITSWTPSVEKLSTLGNFLNFGSNVTDAITNNSSTLFSGVVFPLSTTYHVKAIVNYTTSKVTITVTNKSNGDTKTVSDLGFLQSSTSLGKMELVAYRNRLTSAYAVVSWTTSIDNLKVYPPVEVANVTVKYQDSNGVDLQPSRVAADLVVGSTYNALASDKVDITFDSEVYLYDATSTSNVTVATGDASAIVLKFTKSVSTSVKSPNTGKVVDKKYFSLTGIEVESNTIGTVIEKTIYSDGTIEIKKIVNNRR